MSKIFFRIEIDTILDNFEKIDAILNIQRNRNTGYWTYEIVHVDDF